jgi:hypothetical protein
MVIIFDLNTNLKIFKSQTNSPLELIFEQDKVNNALNLTDNFESTFKSLPNVEEYYLFIGDNAGFMDSRVIYIWISNSKFFMNTDFFVMRTNFKETNYMELLQLSKKENRKDLAYSKEPNIGTKKNN